MFGCHMGCPISLVYDVLIKLLFYQTVGELILLLDLVTPRQCTQSIFMSCYILRNVSKLFSSLIKTGTVNLVLPYFWMVLGSDTKCYALGYDFARSHVIP